jgi:anaphase-promoting complex subunit 1
LFYILFSQAWASIVSGYCLGLGIRLAGTSDEEATETLWHYVEVFLKMSSPDCSMSEYFPKNFLESSLCTLLIGLSLILAGTGHLRVLQLCRLMQAKVASTSQITSNSNTYGMEMCVAMATGILFLGGGRYSLSNDDKSIAVLLASVFPKWPINANDNR